MMMKKIPEINRARGYFLYTADGKRYLDMALDWGRLIMGHRHKGYGQAMKNVIDKGIIPGFPSPYAHRLKQAVKAVFGKDCNVYLFKSEEHAKAALAAQGLEYTFWRAFGLNACDPINDPIIPVLPIPLAFAPGVVVSKAELNLAEEPVSPVILAGAVRAVYNLKAFLSEADYSGWEKAGLSETCAGTPAADTSRWRVELPYIYPLCTREQYSAVWDTFLEAGIILSYDYDTPSVLPPYGEVSEGMQKKILKLFS